MAGISAKKQRAQKCVPVFAVFHVPACRLTRTGGGGGGGLCAVGGVYLNLQDVSTSCFDLFVLPQVAEHITRVSSEMCSA